MTQDAPEKAGMRRRARRTIFGEIWAYMRIRKKYWLAPVIVVLFLLGLLIFVGGSAAWSPFIYAL